MSPPLINTALPQQSQDLGEMALKSALSEPQGQAKQATMLALVVKGVLPKASASVTEAPGVYHNARGDWLRAAPAKSFSGTVSASR